MRIKEIFTVPTGEKVTEKHLRRVLVSSVCSILLCMTCLVSTTWAWFMVSVENESNVIQIASPEVDVQIVSVSRNAETEETVVGDPLAAVGGSYTLEAGTYQITVKLRDDNRGTADAFDTLHDIYVAMTCVVANTTESSEAHCIVLNAKNEFSYTILEMTVLEDTKVGLSFTISWMQPEGAVIVNGEPMMIGGGLEESTVEETTVEESIVDETTVNETTTETATTQEMTEEISMEGTTPVGESTNPSVEPEPDGGTLTDESEETDEETTLTPEESLEGQVDHGE